MIAAPRSAVEPSKIPFIPPALVEQLKVGGKLIIPLGEGNVQKMIVLTRTTEDSEDVQDYGDFSFVPMLENTAK